MVFPQLASCGFHGAGEHMPKDKIKQAIELRNQGMFAEATSLLHECLKLAPDDPDVNYQMAWTCDAQGNESAAVPYYEKALAHGLVDDRAGAFLGLGSTYRCLGQYAKSLDVFDRAILEFPNDRGLQVFRALTLFNLDRAEESVQTLLLQLLDTTSDAQIQSYDRALRFYADKLKQTWV